MMEEQPALAPLRTWLKHPRNAAGAGVGANAHLPSPCVQKP